MSMAHVVGVLKRDPCQKCQLPVFLAERLTVGKRIYHRTCLKCARCGSQLTPGSFYETEVDDEYCCETCPDEEETSGETASSSVILQNTVKDEVIDEPVTLRSRSMRGSIAERLTFFEQSKIGGEVATSAAGSKLLQKSVTDEEKSKSLQRMEATTAPYKMNTALSHFLNDTIDGTQEAEAESEPTSTQMETSDSEEETAEDLSVDTTKLPALPITQPPQVEEKKPPETPKKRFTATAQLQLQLSPTEVQISEIVPDQQRVEIIADANTQDQQHNITKRTPGAEQMEPQLNIEITSTSTKKIKSNDNANNNGQQEKAEYKTETGTEIKESHKLPQKSLEIDLKLSQSNDNDYVTKDKTADTDTAAAHAPSSVHSVTQLKNILQELDSESSVDDADPNVELRTKIKTFEEKEQHQERELEQLHHTEDTETTERLSVVRARLQQFEVIANNKNNNNNKSPEKDNINNNDKHKYKDNLSEKDKNNLQTSSIKMHIDISSLNENSTNDLDDVPKTMPHGNLEDETKLKAMEVDKVDIIEDTIVPEKRNEVPLDVKTKDNLENIEIKQEEHDDVDIEMKEEAEEQKQVVKPIESVEPIKIVEPIKPVESITVEKVTTQKTTKKEIVEDDYPEDLNPFKSDDEDDDDDDNNDTNKENIQLRAKTAQPRALNTSATKHAEKSNNLNPFDSSDDEIELEKSHRSTASSSSASKVPPPRPPPPRISRNPFGDDATNENLSFSRGSSQSSSLTKKTPVPRPRTNLSQSQNPTPEPTPRLSTKSPQPHMQSALQNSSDYYGSANSLSATTPQSLQRNSEARGSSNSLTSSSGGTVRSRKARKAPAPPLPMPPAPVKELFPSNETIDSSKTSTPSSSNVGSPKSGRKKRPAPAPPKPARLDPALFPQINVEHESTVTASKNLLNYPLQSELDSKLSDEEKALLEGNQLRNEMHNDDDNSRRHARRLIPLDASLLAEHGQSDDLKYQQQEETNVVYRRVLIPAIIDTTPTRETNPLHDELNMLTHDRQLEKLKDNKEAKNRNRQSQISASSGAEDSDPSTLYNKSSHGKWKRRKGPAPALPIPPRKVLQMLPLQEIRHELEIIEVQQQGLEKQGVILEKMIRDRCEGQNGEPINSAASSGADVKDAGGDIGSGSSKSAPIVVENTQNSKEVEDLILQLFELVNEKNELFRRQAELMYLRRQHRLEQEQADLEYEIRVLMAQPERNKTDTDKSREEALIARLVEVVQLRNEVIECLEMDRLREAEEDLSIKQRLELHTAKREGDDAANKKTLSKLSKKEKKKQKEAKKLSKSMKIDADKDADETELNMDKQKIKKKKKKLFF